MWGACSSWHCRPMRAACMWGGGGDATSVIMVIHWYEWIRNTRTSCEGPRMHPSDSQDIPLFAVPRCFGLRRTNQRGTHGLSTMPGRPSHANAVWEESVPSAPRCARPRTALDKAALCHIQCALLFLVIVRSRLLFFDDRSHGLPILSHTATDGQCRGKTGLAAPCNAFVGGCESACTRE